MPSMARSSRLADAPCSRHAMKCVVTPPRRGFWVLATALLLSSIAQAQDALPSFRELEAAGATIGIVRVLPQDVFDTTDPREDKLLFRWANALHITTRPAVIERALLFKSGDKLSVRRIEETERVL